MEQSGLAAAVEFAGGVWDLSLEQILEFRLTEECLSMYYADGSKRRSTKSRLLQHLNLNTVDIPKEYISIVDMGFIWCLTTAEDRETTKRDGHAFLLSDYWEKVDLSCTETAFCS